MENIMDIILSGILIATISSWITVNLTLRRYRSERWWDRKVETYTRILHIIYEKRSYSLTYIQAENRGDTLTDKEHKALIKHADEFQEKIRYERDVGAFFLSNEAVSRLHKLEKEEKQAAKATDLWKHLSEDWNATNTCLSDMIQIARKDLKPEPWSLRLIWL